MNDDYFGVALVGEIPFLELGSCKITNEEQQDGSWVQKLTYNGGEIIF